MLDLEQIEKEWVSLRSCLEDCHERSEWAIEHIPQLIEEIVWLRLQLEFAKIDAGCAEGIGHEKGYDEGCSQSRILQEEAYNEGYAAAKHDIEDRSHS